MSRVLLLVVMVTVSGAVVRANLGSAAGPAPGVATRSWTSAERTTLFQLSLTTLPALPADPSNRVADDPRAVELGRELFFDSTLSANGKVSCASCHSPQKDFQDGLPVGHGVAVGNRRTMPIAGTSRNAFMFWDGRMDSQWAQALGPLENPLEHGTTRTQVAQAVVQRHGKEYAQLFGAPPAVAGIPRGAGPNGDVAGRAAWSRLPAQRQEDISRVYANVGKSIAAFERRVTYGRSRVDAWIDAEQAGVPESQRDASARLSDEEARGARLFVGRANCATCHSGARLTDDAFHNTGVPVAAGQALDDGRATGARNAVSSEFSCLSRFSDAHSADACAELRFVDTTDQKLVRAYKVPSLRNVAQRAPFMHAGQFRTLEEVIAHYDRAPKAPAGVSELKPLHLSAAEQRQLLAFLRALDAAPVAQPASLITPPEN